MSSLPEEQNDQPNQPAPPAQTAPPAQAAPAAKGSDDNLMAALSYIFLLSVVMLLVKKDSDYVQFHAKQGTVLFIGEVILGVVGSFTWFLFVLWDLVWVLFVIVSIIGFYRAYRGERYRLPVVADLADKIKI
ncbi:MAG: hypothetical protein A2126_04905 [Candidatus Woykebacteria bacterium GWB1_45_5]|uniref:DUF4870 domain-containing protein n=1 Tax=Candidatus Woykebacteria bacterium GWB1_45_5 TaxID=1802592 RepID=A0A1G1WAS9_9BACT|nr:MAG: hypothetical protein A2126_04905 [Candidatus Woykebacteria bacterium GWB1_45_5]